MGTQTGIGRAMAELVGRLTPEERQEFVHWLSWEELEALQDEKPVPSTAEKPVRQTGEPRVYVGAITDGLAMELPIECVMAFMKRLPAILSVSSIEAYLREGGRGKEYQIRSEDFADFLDAHQDTLLEGSVMVELDGATLVSGGGGCLLLTMDDIHGEVRRRLATEALRACGFESEFRGDHFTATVWNDTLELVDR